MGFIVRTIFWLGLAMAMLPPEARLGGGDDAPNIRDVDVSLAMKNASETLQAWGSKVANVCETNPQLCKAGSDVVNSSLAAAANTAGTFAAALRDGTQMPLAPAKTVKQASQKFQARVE